MDPDRRAPDAAPLALGLACLAAGILLILGALQRTGLLSPAGDAAWALWVAVPAAVRFAVFAIALGALFGGGVSALRLTWKRTARLDLFASAGFLLAGAALLVAATANPQYGASQATAMALGGILVAGFVATLLSASRRLAAGRQAKGAATAQPPVPEAGSKPP